MPHARAAMPAAAKNPDLVYKIRLLQWYDFSGLLSGGKNIPSRPNNIFMRALLLILLFTVLVSETCAEKKARKKAATETATTAEPANTGKTPVCIQAKIDSIKKLPRFNPPAEVTEYLYNEKRVFLFTSDCCDFFNAVYGENCEYVCAPSGGISGQGDFKCKDFTKNAKLVKLVWKDERK